MSPTREFRVDTYVNPVRSEGFNVTIEAPDWALDGGFPEDLPFTSAADVPEDAVCVEPIVADASSSEMCAIFTANGKNYKVKLSEIKGV